MCKKKKRGQKQDEDRRKEVNNVPAREGQWKTEEDVGRTNNVQVVAWKFGGVQKSPKQQAPQRTTKED